MNIIIEVSNDGMFKWIFCSNIFRRYRCFVQFYRVTLILLFLGNVGKNNFFLQFMRRINTTKRFSGAICLAMLMVELAFDQVIETAHI